jgi:hypothetical protein
MGEIDIIQQKNRPGFVYIVNIPKEGRIWNHPEKLYKIGCTTNLKSRLAGINQQVGEMCQYIAYVPARDRFYVEGKLLIYCYNDNYQEPERNWWPNDFFLFNDKKLKRVIRKLNQYCHDYEKEIKHIAAHPISFEEISSIPTIFDSFLSL